MATEFNQMKQPKFTNEHERMIANHHSRISILEDAVNSLCGPKITPTKPSKPPAMERVKDCAAWVLVWCVPCFLLGCAVVFVAWSWLEVIKYGNKAPGFAIFGCCLSAFAALAALVVGTACAFEWANKRRCRR